MGARGMFAGPRVAAAMLAAGLVLAACVDESHELQVQALGSEAPGVSPGPLHRPGQPCLTCHGEAGPSSHTFVIAGTVFAVQDQSAPAEGVNVAMEDSTGSFFTATTNQAGNFFIATGEWSPTFPALVSIAKGQTSEQMSTHIGRAGSCADCHTLTPGPTSAGPVYLQRAAMEGGP
jgi:hypothetical protein